MMAVHEQAAYIFKYEDVLIPRILRSNERIN